MEILKKYEIIELLGNGSYGVVNKAKSLKDGKEYALKIMKS